MGIIILEDPNIILLQIQYNNRHDNSITSAECQLRDASWHTFSQAACSLFSDCPVAKSCASSIPQEMTKLSTRKKFIASRRSREKTVFPRRGFTWSACSGLLWDAPSVLKSVQLSTYCRLVALELQINVSC